MVRRFSLLGHRARDGSGPHQDRQGVLLAARPKRVLSVSEAVFVGYAQPFQLYAGAGVRAGRAAEHDGSGGIWQVQELFRELFAPAVVAKQERYRDIAL